MNNDIESHKNITLEELHKEVQRLSNEVDELRKIIAINKEYSKFDPRLLSMNY